MSGRRTALYEILAMSAIAALCVAIAVSCHMRCSRASQDVHALDTGMGVVQSVADMIAGSNGDMAGVRGLYDIPAGAPFVLYFDQNFERTDAVHASYQIFTSNETSGFEGRLGTMDVILARADGSELFRVIASWQEDRP